MKDLFKLPGGPEIASGLMPSVDPQNATLWVDGRNITFGEGFVAKTAGWERQFNSPTTLPVRGMGQNIAGNVRRIFFGDAQSLHVWNETTVQTVGTGFTGNANETVGFPASVWSFAPFGSWMLATNGKDAPQVWKGSGSFAPLSGVTFSKAELFVRQGPYILAMNTSVGPNEIAWCHDDNVELWSPAITNTAGAITLRDMPSEIVAAVKLADAIAVYGRNSMHVLRYVGMPYVFGAFPALEGIGAVSKAAVVSIGRLNFGFGPSGIWQTDGVSFEYIDTPQIREYLLTNVNLTRAAGQPSKICAWHNDRAQEVVFSYPKGNALEPNESVSYNYKTKAWSLHSYGRTAGMERLVFDLPIATDKDGNVYFHHKGDNADGFALSSWLQTKPLDCGSAEVWKQVQAIQLRLQKLRGAGVQLYVGTQERLTDAMVWKGPYSTTAGFDQIFPTGGANGVFITLKFVSDGLGDAWELGGFTLRGDAAGDLTR